MSIETAEARKRRLARERKRRHRARKRTEQAAEATTTTPPVKINRPATDDWNRYGSDSHRVLEWASTDIREWPPKWLPRADALDGAEVLAASVTTIPAWNLVTGMLKHAGIRPRDLEDNRGRLLAWLTVELNRAYDDLPRLIRQRDAERQQRREARA